MITRRDRLSIETERAREVVATVRDYLRHHGQVPDFRHKDMLELSNSACERIHSCLERCKAVDGDLTAQEFLAAERVVYLLEWLCNQVISVQQGGRLRLVHVDNEEMKKAA